MSEIADQYAIWRGMLETGDVSPMHLRNSDIHPGRYKTKMGERWVPVAIWRDGENVLHFWRDGKPIEDAGKRLDIYSYCRPVTEKEYEWIGSDKSGDAIYSEIPSDPVKLRARVERIAAIPAVIEDGDDARRMSDIAHVLKQIENICSEREKAEAAPLKKKLADVKARWGFPAELAVAARAPVLREITRHLKSKNEPGGAKGSIGRSLSLRTYTVMEIDDYPLALAHFVETQPEKFRETVEKLARAAIKAGEKVPGAKETEDQRAQ